MQNKNIKDAFHVHLTFYEEVEDPKPVVTKSYGAFTSSNIRFTEAPRRKMRYLEFQMNQKQKENIQQIMERTEAAIKEVLEDYE